MTDLHATALTGTRAGVAVITAMLDGPADSPLPYEQVAVLNRVERIALMAFLATTCTGLLRTVCELLGHDPVEVLQAFALGVAAEAENG